MELTTDRERERVAVHEAAHVAAGLLLGRPVNGAWINGDGTGGSLVGTVKADHEIDLEAALDDLVIHLIADLTHPTTAVPYYLNDEPGTDQQQALDVALRVTNSPAEASAVVALGRARAQEVAGDPAFVDLTERIAAELVERGELSGDDIAQLLREESAEKE